MSVWFEGEGDIACSLQRVKDELRSPGAFYVGVIAEMPGLSRVELIDEGADFVMLETNEGTMRRTNISVQVEPERVVVELDEVYEAGSKVTAKTHFLDEFTATEAGVRHRTALSGVEAKGFLGFLYRNLASKNIGNAFLAAYRKHLETA